MDEVADAGELARGGAERTSRLVQLLKGIDERALLAPSALEGWSRLTIVCHLRYGASAVLRMTRDVLAGRQTAYYPAGRRVQRPGTLRPAEDESPGDVISSWAETAAELDAEWASLPDEDWALRIVEPPDNPDLGTIPLWRLALSRLTEVDVHGTDLAIGFPDWSTTLIQVALPTRLGSLSTRRTNHRQFDRTLRGSWLLAPGDGPAWFVAVDGEQVESRPANAGRETASATIAGTSRDLLALLLGRPTAEPLRLSGDIAFARSFSLAFPGP